MKNQVIAEVTIVPVGTAEAGVSRYVAASLEPLERAPDLSYQLTAMGTIISGPLTRVLEVIEQMHEAPFSSGVKRVLTTIRIDERRDKPQTMTTKIESVRRLLPQVKT